jgi:signal transduction histidine kinase
VDSLARFFEINWVAVYFVYGQVFFVTGLVTALQGRRRSQLELARSLRWLAAFGIIHAFNEWGYIFTPLQAFFLSNTLVTTSQIVHLAVLGTSLFCLLQFGILLSRPKRPRWVRAIAGVVFILWAGITALLANLDLYSWEELLRVGDILSRYSMALPGSILACLGFLRQARQVQSAGLPRIARFLRGAAYTFAGYAVAGGLVVPLGPFPPASWINYDALVAAIGIPIPVFRSILGLAMAYTVTRSLEVFQAETDQRIEAIERQRLLAEDRERIGRELHDGIIQSIFAAGLRLESSLPLVEEQPGEAQRAIRAAMASLNGTIGNIRDYIFDLQRSDGHRELEAVLGELVRELQLDTYLEVEYKVRGERCCRLPAARAEQIVQIAREALSNAVRHAEAQRVSVRLAYEGHRILLAVADDGVGLTSSPGPSGSGNGHGLANIRKRVEVLQGELNLESVPGGGTEIKVVIPCNADGEVC